LFLIRKSFNNALSALEVTKHKLAEWSDFNGMSWFRYFDICRLWFA